MVITSEFKILLDLYFLIHSNKHRLEKQDAFELKDLLKPVVAMTTGVNGSNTAKINPNQSVSALIPLDRPKTN